MHATALNPTAPQGDGVDSLLARCLDAPAGERPALVEQLCAEQPTLAAELRCRLQLLAGMGLVDDAPHAAALPERLGDFRIKQCLGGGGMGVVYLAEQESLGREVALKLIRPEHLYFPGAKARFEREVLAAAQLQHPGIARVYCVGEENGVPFFAMERVHGCSLAELLDALRELPVERVTARDLAAALARLGGGDAAAAPDLGTSYVDACCRIAADVADALVHAHAQGIVHRDLKPSNIMLTAQGRAVLVDFGLSSRNEVSKLTRAGTLMGSLPYMAPEQLRGEATDARVDVYGLGVTLYEMLTLREAYGGDSSEEVRRAVLDAAARPPRILNRRVPWDAETVCLGAMAPERSRRYPSIAALRDDLRAFLSHHPIAARRPGPFLRARRFVQRHPTATALAALALVLVGVLPTVLLVNAQAARARVEQQRDVALRVQSILIDGFDLADPNVHAGREPLAVELLDRAAQRIDADPTLDAAVRAPLLRAVGRAYAGLARFDRAERYLRAYLAAAGPEELARDEAFLARDRLAVALIGAGRVAPARDVIEAAVADCRAQRGEDTTLLPHLLVTLASAHGNADDLAQAEVHCRAALALFLRATPLPALAIADTSARLAEIVLPHDGPEALRLAESAVVLLRQHGQSDQPPMVLALRLQGRVLRTTGDTEAAVAALREAVALSARIYAADHVQLLDARQQLALALAQAGDFDAARQEVDPAIAAHRRRVAIDQGAGLMRALTFLGSVQMQQDDTAAALVTYEECLALAKQLHGAAAPTTLDAHCNLGRALIEKGDNAGALAQYAIAAETRLAAGLRDEATILTLCDYAKVLQATGDGDASVRTAERAVELARQALPSPHATTASALVQLGHMHRYRSEFAAARQAHAAALAIDRELGARADPARVLAHHRRLADCCEHLGELAAAAEHYQAWAERLQARPPIDGARLGAVFLALASVYTRLGRDDDAVTALTAARAQPARARDALVALATLHRRRGDEAQLREVDAALQALGESR